MSVPKLLSTDPFGDDHPVMVNVDDAQQMWWETDLEFAVRSSKFTYRDIFCNSALKEALVEDISSSKLLFAKREIEIQKLEQEGRPNIDRSRKLLQKDKEAIREKQLQNLIQRWAQKPS